jgi:cyclase
MVARRTILKSALGAAAVASLARAFAATGTKIDVARVTDSIALLTGAGGNVLALSTAEGFVVVDSGAAAATVDLQTALGALPNGNKIRTLFNTHWHHEQTGGNEALGRGAAIVAHEKTRQRLSIGYYVPAEDRYEKPVAVAAQPTESFYTTGETKIANQRVEYGYLLEAHTDGDCYVYFRDANVIAVGDAASPTRDPELDWFGGGWLGGRVDALDLLLKLGNATTKYVPSYGPAVGRADVQKERDMSLKLFERFVDLVRKGQSADDIFAGGNMNDIGRTWANPKKFVHDAFKGFWAHHNTLMPDIV